MARAGAMIGAGLVLALAATIAPLPLPAEAPGASLTVRLPALVQLTVLALFALSALLLLFLQRRPRQAEDEAVPRRAQRRPSAWTAFVALLPFLVLVGVAWYVVANRGPARAIREGRTAGRSRRPARECGRQTGPASRPLP